MRRLARRTPTDLKVKGHLQQRAAGLVGVVTPPVGALILAVDGLLTPGADPVHETVSVLAAPGAPHALVAGLTLAAIGVAMLGVAVVQVRRDRFVLGPLLLGLGGLALIGVSLVPRDPSRTAVFLVHRLLALTLFGALVGAPLLTGLRLRRSGGQRMLAALSLAAAAGAIALAVAGAALVVPGRMPSGAWERVFAGWGLLWVVVVSTSLLRRPSPPQEGSAPVPATGR